MKQAITTSKSYHKTLSSAPRFLRALGHGLLGLAVLFVASLSISASYFITSLGHIPRPPYSFISLPKLNLDSTQIVSFLLVAAVMLVGLFIFIYCASRFFRHFSSLCARFFEVNPFIVDLLLSFTAWTFVISLLLHLLPALTIYATIALVLNQLLFALDFAFIKASPKD